ncbi:MAG: hypothetical protein NVS1B13_24330 [Flavisolibacter sp.]
MRTFLIIIGSFLFTAAQVCGCGACKVSAQTSLNLRIKDLPKTVKFKITGMSCVGCSNQVATTLKAMEGIIDQKVEYPGNLATVTYNPAKTTVTDIIKAVEKLGFKVIMVSEKTKQS